MIPTSVENIFLDEINLHAKFNIFKSGNKESYEVEKTKLTFNNSDLYPSLYSIIFNFSIDFIKIELSDKELMNIIKKNESILENGWCKLSIRKILDFKKLPEKVALEALELGINVLIRNKFNNAINNLENRIDSLNTTDYFNF